MCKKQILNQYFYCVFKKIKSAWRRFIYHPSCTLIRMTWLLLSFVFKAVVIIIAHPIATFFVVLMQLILGALLGVQFGISLPSVTNHNTGFWGLFPTLWKSLIPEVQHIAITVVAISLMKAFSDAIKSLIEKRAEKQRIRQEHLVPSGHYFGTYINTVRDVLNDKYLIDSGDKEPLEVIGDSLKHIRNLASEYDDLSTDTISINLMLSMRTDESEEQVEKNWEKIHMFFDGATAKAACSQIDGVLVPIAVSHKNKRADVYIGTGRIKDNPLLLPIVEDDLSNTKTKQRVIGAPKAFSTNCTQYHPNFLSSVDDWLFREQKKYITEEQAELLYKYYIDDSSARSLLSIPISSVYPKFDENGKQIEGKTTNLVLNIYAQHECLLRGNPCVFIGLVQPLLDTISYALDIWLMNVERTKTQEPENNDGV